MTHTSPGFTIVESLVALAILSIALVSFYEAGGRTLQASNHLEMVQNAALLANSKLNEVASNNSLLSPASSGLFPGTSYSWSIFARTLPTGARSSGAARLQDVTIIISWREALNQQSISIDTRHLGSEPQ